jgi:hypothetical protein
MSPEIPARVFIAGEEAMRTGEGTAVGQTPWGNSWLITMYRL